MLLRYIVIFVIGILSTFIIQDDLFNQYNLMLNIFFRITWALFFSLIICLLQNYKRKGKVIESDCFLNNR